MAVQIIEQAMPYGKLAENFGRNLGESMGEEVGRQVTARGTRNLADQLAESGITDRLELSTRLMQVPGMTPERLQLLLPQFESSLRSRAAHKLGAEDQGLQQVGGAPSFPTQPQGQQLAQMQPQAQAQAQPQQTQGQPRPAQEAVIQEDITTLVTPESQKVLLKTEFVPTETQRLSGSAKLQNERPGLYPTFDDAQAAYDREVAAHNANLGQEKALAQQQELLTQKVRQDTEQRINNKLQVSGLPEAWANLPGTMQDKLLNRSIEKVSKGMVAAKAAEQVAKDSLGTVRRINKFVQEPKKALLGRGDPELTDYLSQYQKLYADLNASHEFDSELKKKGFGDHMAASIAYPASVGVRKELARLSDLAKKSKTERIGLSGREAGLFPNIPAIVADKLSEKQRTLRATESAEKMVARLSPNDSIYSIALAFNDAGLDENILYDKLREARDSGEFEPTDRQAQELEQALPVQATLEDLYRGALPGVRSGKHGFFESVMRRFGGKR